MLTVEELRDLKDPVVDQYLKRQDRTLEEMTTSQIMHMADSFGRPGSQTWGGKLYKEALHKNRIATLELAIYCLLKGYSHLEDYDYLLEEFEALDSAL